MKAQFQTNNRAALTLIELLVVISIVAILGGLLLPVLSQASLRGRSAQAINNMRQLGLAWLLYADDHEGKLAPNTMGLQSGKTAKSESWVGGWLDFSPNMDNIDTAMLIDPATRPFAGHLGPYLNTPAVFRDPSDRSQIQMFGQKFNRTRSVSMNAFMNGRNFWADQAERFRVFRNIGDIIRPSPSHTWVMMTEEPRSINDGTFVVDMIGTTAFDFPATYYDGGNHIVFADGHVESRKWDWLIIRPINPDDLRYASWCPKPPNPDMNWLKERTTSSR